MVSRYVFDSPLFWTDELANFLFLWLSMLGMVVALRALRLEEVPRVFFIELGGGLLDERHRRSLGLPFDRLLVDGDVFCDHPLGGEMVLDRTSAGGAIELARARQSIDQ